MKVEIANVGCVDRRHFGQLDSLRAFAVFGVLLSHWVPGHYLPVGIWGVRLFFVLSGFLITSILLQARDDAGAAGVGRGRVLAAFYARRFLRIFPLYYATLAFAAVINPANRVHLSWFVTYTQNLLFAWDGESRQMPHLWSLAVEEQFYLVWPWLMLFTPRRRLTAMIIAVIALGPVTKSLALCFGLSPYSTTVLPTASLDTLGAGALLALTMHVRGGRPDDARRVIRIVFVVGIILLVVSAYLSKTGMGRGAWDLYDDSAAAVGFAGLVGLATLGFGGPFGWLLDLRSFREIGKVSYGIYVLHLFAPGQVAKFAGWFGLEPARVASPSIWLGVTLIAAFTSWYLYELPINKMKNYFPYLGKKDSSRLLTAARHDGEMPSKARVCDGP